MRIGIDLSGSEALVAVHRDGRARLAVLGPMGVTFPLCAHRGQSGAVLVGSRALEASAVDPTGFVPDVRAELLFDVAPPVSLLTTLVAELVQRVEASEATPAKAVVVVHADELEPEAVARLVDAARRAAPRPTSALPSSEARARASDLAGVDPSHRGALGAAMAPDAPPTLRLQSASSLPPPTEPEHHPGPSVFESEDEWSSDPDTQHTAAYPPVRDLPSERDDDLYDDDADEGRGWWVALGAGTLAVIVALGAILAITSGGSSDGGGVVTTEPSVTDSPGVTTDVTSTTPDTSVATTTTEVATTTSSSTSTTSTSSTTTTIPPPPLPQQGRVGLFQGWLTIDPGTDDEVTVFLGDPFDEVRELIESRLGPPDGETGFGVDDSCVGDSVNLVEYDSLSLVFIDGLNGSDTPTFEQWYVDGDRPPDLVTEEGIGVGATLGQIRRVLEIAEFTPIGDGGAVTFEISNGNENPIVAVATGQGDLDRVTGLWSGSACELLDDE